MKFLVSAQNRLKKKVNLLKLPSDWVVVSCLIDYLYAPYNL